ncbi:hypothetical protein HPB47_009610 [Ixodes persulcatus]|uniref:Uncharacterized protein n=1 Tax=Ixodes persulcatus TaxID=34615 RepID=A0AC60P1R0_IXOPE|nr:hypothetical protein HPB47_009610 [Ixodes persulcatus]
MADTADEVLAVVNKTLAEGVKNETVKYQPTPAGMAVAYVGIMLMAFFPIIYGSFKSVTHQKKQKASAASTNICQLSQVHVGARFVLSLLRLRPELRLLWASKFLLWGFS